MIARTRPLHVERAGRAVRLDYERPGLDSPSVTARDNRPAAGAGSCVWSHTFFSTMSEADWQEQRDAEDGQRATSAGR